MPRKRRASVTSLDDDDYPDEKYSKDEVEGRAPRNAANARERARMRVLSKAFCRLKTTLPWVPADTKLSKLDTLRLAATYIAHLRAVLRDDNDGYNDSTRSLSLALSWPFAIQGTPPVFLNSSCAVSPSSQIPNSNHYGRQQLHNPHEVQNYTVNHENTSNRHDQVYY